MIRYLLFLFLILSIFTCAVVQENQKLEKKAEISVIEK